MKFITFKTKYEIVHTNIDKIVDMYHQNYKTENGATVDNYGIELVSTGNPDGGSEYALSKEEYERLCDVLGVPK